MADERLQTSLGDDDIKTTWRQGEGPASAGVQADPDASDGTDGTDVSDADGTDSDADTTDK